MELLKNRIVEEGIVVNEDVLKVDSFLNHQVDCKLMKEVGHEFVEHFKHKNVTKVFTIESSGITPATFVAIELNVPLVILKKQTSKILNGDFLQTEVISYTKNSKYNLTLAKKYINENDNILIIDDFLANGEASKGALNLIQQGNAKSVGIGIIIEKAFQPGRKKLVDMGHEVYSLARIKSLENNTIEFL